MLDTSKAKKTGFLKKLKSVYGIINELDYSLLKSVQLDRQILMTMKLNEVKEQDISTQLKETEKENKQLLHMLQLGDRKGRIVPRTNSNTSCETMSLVHLQYKYEELAANQNGLLKILDMRHNEVKKYQEENVKLKKDIENFKFTLQKYEMEFTKLLEDVKKTKRKKNKKIFKLRSERDTLRLVHNKFVELLNQQAIEQDQLLVEQLKCTENSDRALLIQEIRKNNAFAHENFQLRQKLEYLEGKLKAKKSSKKSYSYSKTSTNFSVEN